MKPKVKTLKNGLRIITVPMKDNPTVTVLVMVEAGTRYETHTTNGLSHFLEHMCFKGTKKRGSLDIAYELEAMGAQTNAFTWYDYTGYYAKGRAALFPKLLDVVSDVYLNSTFPEAEIEKERGVICGEIDMYEDLPQRRVGEVFAESLYGDQPAGYTVLGPKENIRKFTRNDFVKYHADHYIAAKTVIVVAGNIDAADVEKQVIAAFKAIPEKSRKEKKKITSTSGDRITIKHKKTDQSHMVIGLRTIPMGHPDTAALGVLVGVLGNGMSSRLFTKLREEMGAGYYVKANYPRGNDYGELEISTGTEPARVPEVMQAIRAEINRMKNELVPAAELEKTKAYLVGNLYMGLESSDSVAFYFADEAILHQELKAPKMAEQEIRKVTAADIQRVAKKYLKSEKFHMALIGPHSTTLEIEQSL
jgi:predicted Zn-dependent peptidase